MILYRPVGTKELALIAASGYTQFPPRLWVPADELERFNQHIIGTIQVICEFS